jgi:hypothetical protein
MNEITVKLPKNVATQLEVEQVDREELASFLIAAVQAWLTRRKAATEQTRLPRPWSEAFQESAVMFIDQLIDENQALFEELARL